MAGRKNRNPFTIRLMVYMIESEACMAFGQGRESLAKYLALPSYHSCFTPEEFRKYRYPYDMKLSEREELKNRAKTLIRKVIQERKYLFSDEMLNDIVSRFTFYERFNFFGDFEAKYEKYSKPFSEYSGKHIDEIPPDELAEISNAALYVYMLENIFLRQTGRLNGEDYKVVKQLSDGYALRSGNEWEFNSRYEVRVEQDLHSFLYFPDGDDLVIKNYLENKVDSFEYYYKLINPHNQIIGDFVMLPNFKNDWSTDFSTNPDDFDIDKPRMMYQLLWVYELWAIDSKLINVCIPTIPELLVSTDCYKFSEDCVIRFISNSQFGNKIKSILYTAKSKKIDPETLCAIYLKETWEDDLYCYYSDLASI